MDNSNNSNNFSVSGPVHLKTVDWTNPDYRRSVAASLVKGVYSLAEYDSQGHQVDVAPWWDFFNFELIRVITNVDDSVITAIYKYKQDPSSYPNAPRYVIAFRGIILKRPTRSQDMTSCIRYILNDLQGDHRFQSALDAVQKIINASAGDPNRVWLAGHSLGSAIALAVGKNMAKNGFVLKNTYLFNPPFIGFPIELIKGKKLIKKGMRIVITFVKAGVGRAVEGGNHPYHSDQSFDVLSDWFPHLFVNPADPICAEYIGYFGNRGVMKRIGAGKIEWHASKISLTSMFSSALTGGDPEALHLLPLAHLTINNNSTPHMIKGVRKFLDSSKKEHIKEAHTINQWWDPSFSGESMKYYYHGQ